MSAHTPGPWMVMQWSATKQWLLLRDVPGTGGLCETMKTPDGFLATFATEKDARAALSKAQP